MAAAGITALLKKMDYKDVVVAIGKKEIKKPQKYRTGSH